MNRIKLTRESILDGTLHASSRALMGNRVRYMTDAERAESIAAVLAGAPRRRRVWVFGYGSLIWNPAFHFVERRPARVYGFRREFCLWAWAGRGSPDCPGLMLSLQSGGSCNGVAYRIAPDQIETELDVVWRREMGSRAYRPVWVVARTAEGGEPAIAFAANRDHERYVPGLPPPEVARLIATASGPLGPCRDYLFDLVAHLRELGFRDRHLELLAERVRAHG
jgi:cation transport protein ChaC